MQTINNICELSTIIFSIQEKTNNIYLKNLPPLNEIHQQNNLLKTTPFDTINLSE